MNTTNDAIDIVWQKINSTVKASIDGDVYKLNRPINSKKEDIVINSLPITPDFPQQCVVNINCYVPNLNVKINGKNDNTIPNTARLKALTNLIMSHTDNVEGANFCYYFEGQATLRSPETNEYFSNIRLFFVFSGEQVVD